MPPVVVAAILRRHLVGRGRARRACPAGFRLASGARRRRAPAGRRAWSPRAAPSPGTAGAVASPVPSASSRTAAASRLQRRCREPGAGRPRRRPALGRGQECRGARSRRAAPRRPRRGVGDARRPGWRRAWTSPRARRSACSTAAELALRCASAAVYALPARYEPFGLSVLEAAPAGLRAGAGGHRDLPRALGAARRSSSSRAGRRARARARRAPRRRRAPRGGRRAAAAPARRDFGDRADDRRLRRRLPRASGGRARAEDRARCGSSYFTHSLASCWNHGNAHFVRGVLRELVAPRPRRHAPTSPKAAGAARISSRDHGDRRRLDRFAGLSRAARRRASIPTRRTSTRCSGARTLVIVHEWNDPALVAAIGRAPPRGGRYRLLFHDTHHRDGQRPRRRSALRPRRLRRRAGLRRGAGRGLPPLGLGATRLRLARGGRRPPFHPPDIEGAARRGLVWIGNWGDGERTRRAGGVPARAGAATAGLPLDIYGVRYPAAAPRRCWPLRRALSRLARRTPARRRSSPAHLATVHVPRAALRRGAARHPDDPACSRRWPAASRWSARPGPTPRACSGPARTTSSARDGAEMERQLVRALARRSGPARGARARRAGDDPRAPHLRPPRRRAAGDRCDLGAAAPASREDVA